MYIFIETKSPGTVMGVTKLIHQSNARTTDNARTRSWKSLNPTWEYRFYTDTDMHQYIETHTSQIRTDFPGLEELIPTCRKIEVIDIFRYLLLYYEGGLWCDVDTDCLKPLDAMPVDFVTAILPLECHLTSADQERKGYKYPYGVGNCIMYAPPSHPFFHAVLGRIVRLKRGVTTQSTDDEVIMTTGPGMLTRSIHAYPGSHACDKRFISMVGEGDGRRITILPQIMWIPPTNPPIYGIYPLNIWSYARHTCDGSWRGADTTNLVTQILEWERHGQPTPFPHAWCFRAAQMINWRFWNTTVSLLPLLHAAQIAYTEIGPGMCVLVANTFAAATAYHMFQSRGCCVERLPGFPYHVYASHVVDNTAVAALMTGLLVQNETYHRILVGVTYLIVPVSWKTLRAIWHFADKSRVMRWCDRIHVVLAAGLIIKYYQVWLAIWWQLPFHGFVYWLNLSGTDYNGSRKFHAMFHLSMYAILCRMLWL
jgi:hypothetical protein